MWFFKVFPIAATASKAIGGGLSARQSFKYMNILIGHCR